MTLVACDPGVSGAIAYYDYKLGRLDLYPMPTAQKPRRGRYGPLTIVDEAGVVSLMAVLAELGAKHFFIEQVQGMPGQSAPAAFNFGQGYGVLRAAAVAAGMTVESVAPSVWKAAMKVPADKTEARARASEMIPTHKHLWTRAKDDGLAEAALLALWGYQRITGGVKRTPTEKRAIERAKEARAAAEVRKAQKREATKARMRAEGTYPRPGMDRGKV